MSFAARAIVSPPALQPEGWEGLSVRVLFTTRHPLAGEAPFNLGEHPDPPQAMVQRALLARQLGLPVDQLLLCRQTHSARVHAVSAPWSGPPPEGDALVTATPGLLIAVLTADCLPLILLDPVARVAGAVHAGWRGALAGVIPAGIAAMTALGAEPGRLLAWIGPCLRQPRFEVGPEMMVPFLTAHPRANLFFSPPGRFGPRPHFDLAGFATRQLIDIGLLSDHIWDDGVCTYEQESACFSHRRASHRPGELSGRQLAGIVLDR